MRRGLFTLYDQSPSVLYLGDPVARDLHVVIDPDAAMPIGIYESWLLYTS